MYGANATTKLTTTGADPTCTDCQRYQEKYTFPAEYQLRTCHGVSTAVHVRKACIWMRRTNANTIDAFNAGRCFDQRRPIQERPESPCENGTADDLLWRFQISQSICTSKTFTSASHRPSALRSPLALGVGKPVRRGLGSQSFSRLEWCLHMCLS